MPSPKQQLRQDARARRGALLAACPDFAARIATQAENLGLAEDTVVGGYYPFNAEADPTLLLARLVVLGCHAAFPRMVGKDAPLEFHRIPDGEVLREGALGIHEPAPHFPTATPQVLLVPLLGFDAAGHRLGYGGGFYDRTLAGLKAQAIGIAYAGQQMDFLPHDAHDYPLDLVLTEHGITRFR